MAILKIARIGHPVLAGIAQRVEDPMAPAVRGLITDMVETMLDAPGVGLSAPQVHVPARIVVFEVPENHDTENGGVPLTVLINPEVEPLSEEMEEGVEGCLSLPGMAGRVLRYTKIRYRGLNPAGDAIERVAENYHARVVQHECDHLDGILYPMRMTDLTSFGYIEEMTKALDENAVDEAEAAEPETADA